MNLLLSKQARILERDQRSQRGSPQRHLPRRLLPQLFGQQKLLQNYRLGGCQAKGEDWHTWTRVARQACLGSTWPRTNVLFHATCLFGGRVELGGKDRLTPVPRELVLLASGDTTVHGRFLAGSARLTVLCPGTVLLECKR